MINYTFITTKYWVSVEKYGFVNIITFQKVLREKNNFGHLALELLDWNC